jgi:DNA-binding protein H-NS
MPKRMNLEEMSIDEIWKLHEELSQVLAARLTSEMRQLEKRLAQLSRDQPKHLEVPLEKNLDNAGRRKYPKVLPKYRNSSAPFETWSGRGKRPRWLASALEAGCKIDEFAIDNVAGRGRVRAV